MLMVASPSLLTSKVIPERGVVGITRQTPVFVFQIRILLFHETRPTSLNTEKEETIDRQDNHRETEKQTNNIKRI